MTLRQYTKVLKVLMIIPVVAGLLTIAEAVLPYKTIDTKAISKKSSYREKTGMTTYTIHFAGISDQFTEDIYSKISKGDKVTLEVTYFNKAVRKIHSKKLNMEYTNSTGEGVAVYLFAVGFLLSGAIWTKLTALKKREAFQYTIVVLVGLIFLVRMFN